MKATWRALALAGSTAVAVVGVASCSAPPPPEKPVVKALTTPLPDMPAWSTAMIGKILQEAVPVEGRCIGAFDVVLSKHSGSAPGSEVEGWGYDAERKAEITRYLFAIDGRIVGAGEGGRTRADVPKARPEVLSQKVGWHGMIRAVKGRVEAWGLLPVGRCLIGNADI